MEKSKRLASLDALRGFDMFFIMGLSSLVVAVCALFPGSTSQTIAESMRHVSWDGLTHHDTIFPLFLFLAGVSFPFSLAKQKERGSSTTAICLKVLRRGALLVFLGLVYNGLFDLQFEYFRCGSVLGRIGLAWMFAALFYIFFGIKSRSAIAVVILIGYALLSKYVGAPDVADADPLSREGCFVGYFDRCFMPGYLYVNNMFDPEGLLSALPAIVTAMLGMFTGEFIRLPEKCVSGNRKTLYMLAAAAVMAIVAYFADSFVPINKSLWSSSFVCAVGAYSLAMMAIFYYIIDVRGWQRWTFIFRVVGMNSITIYLAQRIINFNGISNFFFAGIASHCPENIAAIVSSTGYIAVCWFFLYLLYRKQIFLKV